MVAEALAAEADPGELDRLRESITNDDVLALFESERGELTEADPNIDAEELHGGERAPFEE